MTFENAVRRHDRLLTHALGILAIPLIFACSGLILRYAAFQSVSDAPGIAAFADALCKWDCVWYLRIADLGSSR